MSTLCLKVRWDFRTMFSWESFSSMDDFGCQSMIFYSPKGQVSFWLGHMLLGRGYPLGMNTLY